MKHDDPLLSEDAPLIRDGDRSTRGGPPGWLAFAIIVAAAVLIAVVVVAIGLLT